MLIKSERNGHVLEHDEEQHIYMLDGKLLDGVTSILSGGYPKSQRIYDWQTKEGARWSIHKALEPHFAADTDLDEAIESIVKEAPKAHKIALDEACDIGHIVHDYAYHKEKGLEYDLQQHSSHTNWDAILTASTQFDEWKEQNADEIISLEELVCSIKHTYAGRFDRLAERKGVVTLTDYKTSSGFYITQFIQMAAYAMAIEEWMGIVVEDIEIVRFDKKTGKLSTRNLSQLSNTIGIKSATCMKRLKKQFVTTLETYRFKDKFDRYIRK